MLLITIPALRRRRERKILALLYPLRIPLQSKVSLLMAAFLRTTAFGASWGTELEANYGSYKGVNIWTRYSAENRNP